MTEKEFVQRYVAAALAVAKDHRKTGKDVQLTINEAKALFAFIEMDYAGKL